MTKRPTTISSAAAARSGATQPNGCVAARQTLGYIRVSTEKQAESLGAQMAKIHAMALLRGVVMTQADVIVDAGASAKSIDRPGLSWLLAQVDAGTVDTVIIAKLDRLTRKVSDLGPLLLRFDRRDASLVSCAELLDTGTAGGRLVLNILVSVAQWEREAMVERTVDVLQHKRAKGERVGTLPFGLQLVPGDRKRLEPAPVEQRLVARIRELTAHGWSSRKVAVDLNAQGWTTRRGGPWRGEYVARLLRQKAG